MKMLLSSIEIGAREDKERGSQSFQMFCKCHLWESLRPADHFDMDRCCCFKHNLLASVSPVALSDWSKQSMEEWMDAVALGHLGFRPTNQRNGPSKCYRDSQ